MLQEGFYFGMLVFELYEHYNDIPLLPCHPLDSLLEVTLVSSLLL